MKGNTGKLLFVVPLASPERVKSWNGVQHLFERTLRSICAQSNSNFEVVVACHERPRFGFDHPNVHYLEVTHDIPADNFDARRLDKHKKIRLALHHGQNFEHTHTMCVDADDCVSRRLAAHVGRHPGADGWYFRCGYFHSARSGSLYLRRGDFFHWTGSGLIIKRGIFTLPESLTAADLEDQNLLKNTYYHHHSRVESELKPRCVYLNALPFPGAIYVIEHGSNLGTINEPMYRPDSMILRAKRAIFNNRRLTDKIRREFGFYELENQETRLPRVPLS